MPAPIFGASYSQFVTITKSDTVNFVGPNTLGQSYSAPQVVQNANAALCDGIYVGGAGTIVAVQQDGTAVTFAGCLAGTILPIKAIRVNSASTTATAMVALYF